MFRTIFTVFFSLGLTLCISSQTSFSCYSITESVSASGDLEPGTIIWTIEDIVFEDQIAGIWIDSIRQASSFDGNFIISEKIKLKSYFKCLYEFEVFNNDGLFEIKIFNLEDGSKAYVVRQTNLETRYFIYQGEAYLIENCGESELCQNEYYQQPLFDSIQVGIQLGFDTFAFINEAFLYPQTISFLVEDANIEHVIEPPIFQQISNVYLLEDSLTCPSLPVTYEYINDSILIKDAYVQLTEVPTVYDIVEEPTIIHDAYTFFDEMDVETYDSTIVELIRPGHMKYFWQDTLLEGQSANPFSCIMMDSVFVEPQSIELNLKIPESCPAGYTKCGQLCIKRIEVPAVYDTLTKKYLVEPSYVAATPVPAVYQYFVRKQISETSNIPDSCKLAVIDTIQQEILVNTGGTFAITFPLVYEYWIIQELIDDAEIYKSQIEFDSFFTQYNLTRMHEQGVGSVVCDPILIDPLKDLIVTKLFVLGYLESQSIPFGSKVFWDALLHFQEDQGIRMGSIDFETLKALNLI